MPEELNLPEATPTPLRSKPDPLSIEPDPLSIEPDKPAVAPPPPPPATPAAPAPEPLVLEPVAEPVAMLDEAEPISLVDDAEHDEAASGISMVHQRSGLRKAQEVVLNRPLNLTNKGATRCRIFYCRIAVEAIENMQSRINEWIDNEELDVKHVGQELAVMEGKTPRPNLIVTVWY